VSWADAPPMAPADEVKQDDACVAA